MAPKRGKARADDEAEQQRTTQAIADASTTANAGAAEGTNASTTFINAGSSSTINATTVSASIDTPLHASVRRSSRTPHQAAQPAILPPLQDDDDEVPSDIDDSYSDIVVDDDLDIEVRMQEIRAILVKEQATLEDLQKRKVIATVDMYRLRQSRGPMTVEEKATQARSLTRKEAQIKKLSKDIEDLQLRAKAAKELLETRLGNLDQPPLRTVSQARKPSEPTTGIKLPSQYPRFRTGDSTHDFMESFRNNVIPTLSKEDQTWRLHWYLVTLVQNSNQQTTLRNKLEGLLTKVQAETPERVGLDIDEIEKVFHDTCREPEEKKKFINSLRYLNFESKESYRQLSQRIDAARKKTDKGECDQILLLRLSEILPEHAKLHINDHYQDTPCTSIDWTDVKKVCEIMDRMEGPDSTVQADIMRMQQEEQAQALRTEHRTTPIRQGMGPSSHSYERTEHSSQRSWQPNPYVSTSNARKRKYSEREHSRPEPERGSSSSSSYMHCDICGRNNTHTTSQHKECKKCGRKGHVAQDCRQGSFKAGHSEDRKDDRHGNDKERRGSNDNDRSRRHEQENYPNGGFHKQGKRDERREPRSSYSRTHGNVHVNLPNIVPSTIVEKKPFRLKTPHPLVEKNLDDSCIKESPDMDMDLLQLDLEDMELDLEDMELDYEGIDDALNKLSIDDIIYLDRETIVYNAMAENEADDKRVVVKLLFENIWYDALIDTGATKSFIDRTVVKEHNVLSHKTHGQIYLGHKKQFVDRTGRTEPITIWCNNHTLMVPLEILDLRFPFVIGMDIFHRLGFGISGVDDGRENAVTLPPPIPDQRPSLTPLTTPPEELTEDFKRKRNLFLTAIEDVLQENERIPFTSCCPVPEMRVYLPVPKGTRLYRRPRSFAEQQMRIFDEQVAKWLEEEVITQAPAGNPHNNTLTLAAKKDMFGKKTKWRVCLDPRPLNKLLPEDNHPVPLIMDILRRIGGHRIFTTIDLRQAYHRLPIHPADRSLTAFMHDGIQYMFNRAPFGLKPLSSIFQRGMTRILGDLPFVCIFIDDIVIFSKTEEDHEIHVRTVIERLNEAKLIINRDKCRFFATQVVLLGYVVDRKGRRVDPSKLANIQDWQPPTTATQVQSYLGTFNFFREHIPLFSTIAAPLDKLRSKTESFQLNEEELKAFNTFKQLLVQAPILHFPDFAEPFYVATDASNVGIGAVLYQKHKDEVTNKTTNRYVSFMARSLQPSERRYSATKKELLAIVFALQKFHYYLWGRHFTLYTDHRALTYLHSQKDLNPMLTGWQETLLDYNFSVEYRPGVMNVLPDHLSRLFPQEIKTSYDDEKESFMHAYMQYMHDVQDDDEPFNIVADKEEQKRIMDEVHSFGHPGMKAMVNQIHIQRLNWSNIGRDCLDHIKRCRECQRYNIVRKGYHPLKAIHAQLPGEHMAVDLCGPFHPTRKGKRYVLVLVDVCTRFVFLKAIKNKSAPTIGKTLFKIFCLIGFPRVLQSDNGLEFVNKIVKNLTDEFGTKHRLTTPYHPRGNGVVERNVQTALQKIRKEFLNNEAVRDGLPL